MRMVDCSEVGLRVAPLNTLMAIKTHIATNTHITYNLLYLLTILLLPLINYILLYYHTLKIVIKLNK